MPPTRPPDGGRIGTAGPVGHVGRVGPVGPVGEALATLAVSASVAVVMTWPAARHPASTVPEDVGDPLLQAWQVAWGGHALTHQPARLFDANSFWPARHSLAFTDSLLGYAPAGLVGHGFTAALVRYGLLYVLAWAVAAWGGYLLARQLGARPAAAAVAGLGLAYAPWRIAQAGHLNILSTGGMFLALAMLARGHGVRLTAPPTDRGPARPGWALAGWLVASWQITLGFAVGLSFAYLLGLLVVAGTGAALVRPWRGRRVAAGSGRPAPDRRLLAADTAGLVTFLAVGVAMAVPYYLVRRHFPESGRDVAYVALYSPPPRALLTAPAQSLLWGPATAARRAGLTWPPEMTLFPGAVLAALAAVGLAVSAWRPRVRLVLAAAAVVAGVLALGTNVAGGRFSYLVLFAHLPGWDGLRVPGRLVWWLQLALALLAAGCVSALVGRLGRRAGNVVGAVLVVAVLLEGASTVPHPSPVPPPAALAALPGPVLFLPSDDVADAQNVAWTAAGFTPTPNGTAAFQPAALTALRRDVATFPEPAAVAAARAYGVRTVVLVLPGLPGTAWAGADRDPPAGSGVRRLVLGPQAVAYLLQL